MTQTARVLRVALAGNPNSGKTTLFNRVTGSRGKVGNYPGVTVERTVGPWRVDGLGTVELMDVPGMISLSTRSAEEHVAFSAVAGLPPHERPDAVIVVVDACEITRQLYLVLQVLELGLPTVVVLTMLDHFEAAGRRLDVDAMAGELGVPVVVIGDPAGRDLEMLGRALVLAVDGARSAPDSAWRWAPVEPRLVADLDAIAASIPAAWHDGDERLRRALAAWAMVSLADPEQSPPHTTPESLLATVAERRARAEAAGRDVDAEIVRTRYAWIDAHAERFVAMPNAAGTAPRAPTDRSDRIDRVLLHPVLGFLIFVVVMTALFQSLFTVADPIIGWIEDAVAAFGGAAGAVLPDGVVRDFLVDGVIAGVGAVLVFLPQILLLFLFIAVLEGSGYMARVAFLMDRIMRSVGLHGRAFIPMLSGFACAVPAILATRTIERRRDRLLTMLVLPLMTCSARLPVYGLLIAALYPVGSEVPWAQGLLMVAMYLFSTVVALLAAAVLGRTLLKGPRTPLILQMPRYRMPDWRSVVRQMLERSGVFVREAGTVILTCTIAMWLLLSFPRELAPQLDADYAARRAAVAVDEPVRGVEWAQAELAAIDAAESGERLRQSWAAKLGRAIEPALEPLGFDWKVGIGLIGAFAAREVFVSTMAVVYGLDGGDDETSATLRARVREHRWPDGRRVFTPIVCLSLMVFFALACQCLSTLAAAKRETGGYRWPVFMFVYMTALAWLASWLVVRTGALLGLA